MASLSSNYTYPPPTHDQAYGGIAPTHDQQQYYNGFAPSHDHHNESSAHTLPDDRTIVVRTPSPTPSEQNALRGSVFSLKEFNWKQFIDRKYIGYYIAFIVIAVLSALLTIYHDQIVEWLTPVSHWLHQFKLGWLVPVAILFVISFPPLFGHEIVAVLCGVVWGLWLGFGIVALGTFLGEVGNFYAFKYFFRNRAIKLEREKLTYACLAKAVRDGGFKIALAARLSVIPGHFTTAVFSTCGMNIIVFSAAAILSLPKQFLTVYLGVILDSSGSSANKQNKVVTDSVLAVTILITAFAMWYIMHVVNQVKPEVIRERQKRRKLEEMQRKGLDVSEELSSINSSSPTIRQSHDDIESKASTLNGSVYQPKPTRPNKHNVLQKPRRDNKDSAAGTIRPSPAPGMYHDNSSSDSDLGRPALQHATLPESMPRSHSSASTSSSHGSYSSHPYQYGPGAHHPQDDATPKQHNFSSQRSSPPHEVRSTSNLLADNEWDSVTLHERDATAASYATARSDFTPSSSPPPLPSTTHHPALQPGGRVRQGQI